MNKIIPQHSPAPWHQIDDQVVDRHRDPVLTLHRTRHAGDEVRVMEDCNGSAVLATPSMITTLLCLHESLIDGTRRGVGLDAEQCAFLAGLAMGQVLMAVGLDRMPPDFVVRLKGGVS